MKANVSIITLGVADLQASLRFYRDGLGLPTHDYEDGAGIVFFALEGTWLALFPKERFRGKRRTWRTAESGTPTITLAHNVASPAEVDATLAEAAAAGATIAKPAEATFWGGYSGYFSDPDGYLWEVAHNPFMDLT